MITQGLEKLPTYHGSVYRGMIIKRKEFERVFSGGVGIVVKQNRFVSSSNDMNVARLSLQARKDDKKRSAGFLLRLRGKTGVIFPEYQSLRALYLRTNKRCYLQTIHLFTLID